MKWVGPLKDEDFPVRATGTASEAFIYGQRGGPICGPMDMALAVDLQARLNRESGVFERMNERCAPDPGSIEIGPLNPV